MLNLANRTLSANTNRLNLGTQSLAVSANVNIDLALVRTDRDQARHAQPKRPDRIQIQKKPSIFMWMAETSESAWKTLASSTSLATKTASGRGCWEPRNVANRLVEAPPVVRPVVVDDRSADRDRAIRIHLRHFMQMYSRSASSRAVRAAALAETTFASRPGFRG